MGNDVKANRKHRRAEEKRKKRLVMKLSAARPQTHTREQSLSMMVFASLYASGGELFLSDDALKAVTSHPYRMRCERVDGGMRLLLIDDDASATTNDLSVASN